MATQRLRINAALGPSLYEAVDRLARREGVSRSQMLRDLLVRALELFEDAGLAEKRRRTFDPRIALTGSDSPRHGWFRFVRGPRERLPRGP